MLTTWEEDAMKKGIRKGRQEGRQEGKLERNIEIAKNLLKINLSVEQIAQITDLSVEEIEKLKQD